MAAEREKDNPPESKVGIANDLRALRDLIAVGKTLLTKAKTQPLERTLRHLAGSVTNSAVAVAILCTSGYGADAVKVARSMFENHVAFRYLLHRPEELKDFLDFDAVARYKRLQYYRSRVPTIYAGFSAKKVKAVSDAYSVVHKRFMDSKGRLRDRWCRHGIAEMARVAGLSDMYDLFYRYASSLQHTDPMGLGMLIDARTLEVLPGPAERHIHIAIRLATSTLHDILVDYSKLVGIDCSEALKRVEELISGAVEFKGATLGSLTDAYEQ